MDANGPIMFKRFAEDLKRYLPTKLHEFMRHQLPIKKCCHVQLCHVTQPASTLSLTSATASAFASLVSGADVSGLGSGAALGSSTAGAACEPKKLTYKGSLGQEEERPPKQV